ETQPRTTPAPSNPQSRAVISATRAQGHAMLLPKAIRPISRSESLRPLHLRVIFLRLLCGLFVLCVKTHPNERTPPPPQSHPLLRTVCLTSPESSILEDSPHPEIQL